MVQVYFLLVFCNILTGLVLARPGIKKSFGDWDAWFKPFDHRMVRGLLGIFTFLSGFLGLIFVLPGDQIFIGDLFPSVSALLGGTIFVLEYYRKPTEDNDPHHADFLVSNKVIIGVVCLVFGVIHFFSPTVVFL